MELDLGMCIVAIVIHVISGLSLSIRSLNRKHFI